MFDSILVTGCKTKLPTAIPSMRKKVLLLGLIILENWSKLQLFYVEQIWVYLLLLLEISSSIHNTGLFTKALQSNIFENPHSSKEIFKIHWNYCMMDCPCTLATVLNCNFHWWISLWMKSVYCSSKKNILICSPVCLRQHHAAIRGTDFPLSKRLSDGDLKKISIMIFNYEAL